MSTKINVRSPYFVRVTDPALKAVKFNLYIWDGDLVSEVPASPTYEFIKDTIGSNTYIIFEIADLVRDYIETEYNNYSTNAVWVKWTYQMYNNVSRASGTEIGALQTPSPVIALDGYGYFEDGAMPQLSRTILQSNTDIYYLDGRDIVLAVFSEDVDSVALSGTGVTNVYWEQIDSFWQEYDVTWDAGSTGQDVVDSNDSHAKIVYVKITDTENLADTTTLVITNNDTSTINVTLRKVCEPKYTPMNIIFYNKFGAMQNLWFFKKSVSMIEVSSDMFKRNIVDFSSTPSYNTSKHQIKSFNVNAKESLMLNTGFLPENFNEVIKQLIMSEEVWIDNGSQVLPVKVKTSSLELKTSVNNKLIDYTLEFDYAYDKINNIR